jgi:hypothetical protein
LPILIAAVERIDLITVWTLNLLLAVLLGSPLLTLKTEASVKIIGFAFLFPVLALLAAPLIECVSQQRQRRQ